MEPVEEWMKVPGGNEVYLTLSEGSRFEIVTGRGGGKNEFIYTCNLSRRRTLLSMPITRSAMSAQGFRIPARGQHQGHLSHV